TPPWSVWQRLEGVLDAAATTIIGRGSHRSGVLEILGAMEDPTVFQEPHTHTRLLLGLVLRYSEHPIEAAGSSNDGLVLLGLPDDIEQPSHHGNNIEGDDQPVDAPVTSRLAALCGQQGHQHQEEEQQRAERQFDVRVKDAWRYHPYNNAAAHS